MNKEIKRQTVHILGILSVLVILLFGKQVSIILFLIWVGILGVAAEFRRSRKMMRKHPMFKVKFFDVIEKFLHQKVIKRERKGEFTLEGPITFYLGCFIVVVLFPPLLAIASIMVLSISDALSTLVGKLYGKHKLFINKRKTWEGSTVFFISCFIILCFFINPFRAFVASIVITLIEMLPEKDNLTVPFATGVLLYLFI